ncbi:PL29 family lyase N-terminal domain-containing protein [Phocaeicola plebeius]|uniref:PL29 family lyase N-terminal domain-containing protein n=1 Tax=Phocaeicola plebeius TaxID=310297 RepID=UPI0026EDC29B|nr:PL29 family lyase N-terminal domain-containing protein [Phocaeicola plebeius]
MKLYKSLLLGLLMCGFAACDTTDLERDINSLKDRVEDYEAQVQKLNDDMNIIRVLLDGNKTITSYSFDGTNYTLTLSNGETLTLTQGVMGANYPSITIGENGNWIIAGKDSGIKAEAEDGKDAPYTPQFKIENENWWVSYDGGVTWTDLGEKATGDPSGESSLISNVTLASDGNSITIKLSDNNSYTIPVVKDLVCEITEPELADGEMWYIGSTGATLKVKVNIQPGDIIRPVVPADWKAEMSDYSTLSGEQILDVTVTPLAAASKCVVTIEVNRGANTITDEIVARTQTTSYYADYMAGLDIKIGDMTVNKFEYPKSILISSDNVGEFTSFEDGVVYFIETDITPTKSSDISNLVLINNSVDKVSKISFTDKNSLNLKSETSLEAKGLAIKGVRIVAENIGNKSVLALATNDAVYNSVILDGCELALGTDLADNSPSLFYFDSSRKLPQIKKIVLENCFIKVAKQIKEPRIFQMNPSAEKFKSSLVSIKNNIFYCDGIVDLKLCTYANSTLNVLMQNNTFVNVVPHYTQAYLQLIPSANSVVSKNVVVVNNEYVGDIGTNLNFVSSKKDDTTIADVNHANFNDNIVYDINNKKWLWFRNSYGMPSGFKNAVDLLLETPIESILLEEKSVKLKKEWESYGACF